MPAAIVNVTPRSSDPKEFDEDKVLIGTDGAELTNNGKVLALMHNTDVASITVTVVTPALFDADLELADRTVDIGAGEIVIMGPFSTRYYNDAEGKVLFTVAGGDVDEVEILGINI